MYQDPLPILHELRVPYTANPGMYREVNHDHLHHDMVKVTVSSPANAFLINGTTYQKIYNRLKRWYNKPPINGEMVCNSFTVLTQPNTNCNLYYQAGSNENNDSNCNFTLIGSFVTPDQPINLTVTCPYTDSRQQTNALIFNWYMNDPDTGLIIPTTIISNSFFLPNSNSTVPFMELCPYGSFYIEGIIDNIQFHVTALFPKNTFRQREDFYSNEGIGVRPKKVRGHKPREILGSPGEIQWIEPSDDFEYYESRITGDPIYELLDKQ